MLLLLDPASWYAIGTAVASAYSSYRTNKQRKKLANTAVQRRADDLRAAGFNPVLAAGGPAASSPELKDPGTAAVEGGKATSAIALQRRLVTAEEGLKSAQAENLREQTNVSREEAGIRGSRRVLETLKGEFWSEILQLARKVKSVMTDPSVVGFIKKWFTPDFSAKGVGVPGGVKEFGAEANRILEKYGVQKPIGDSLRNDVIDAQGAIRRPGAVREMPDKRKREKIRR